MLVYNWNINVNLLVEYIVVIKVKIKSVKKKRRNIYLAQKNYKKLRSEAHLQLDILEGYFGRNTLNKALVYQQILLHLNSAQKEISYFGLRGVLVGVIATVFTFSFNSMVFPVLIDNIEKSKIFGLLLTVLVSIFFIILFLIAAWEPFSLDRKRRNRLYINEYIIELVKEKVRNNN